MPVPDEEWARFKPIRVKLVTENPSAVKDLSAYLCLDDVLTHSDGIIVQSRVEKDGECAAFNELFNKYRSRANDLWPMVQALRRADLGQYANQLAVELANNGDKTEEAGGHLDVESRNFEPSHQRLKTIEAEQATGTLPSGAILERNRDVTDRFSTGHDCRTNGQTQDEPPSKTELKELTDLLEKFYIDSYQFLRYRDDRPPMNLDEVWVDVQVESSRGEQSTKKIATKRSRTKAKYVTDDYQRCLPGQDRESSVFNASRLVICLGDPGAGKTTLTRKIGVDWAKRDEEKKTGLWQYDLVLIVLLKQVTKDSETIWEMVLENLISLDWMKNKSSTIRKLRKIEANLVGSHPFKRGANDLTALVVLDGKDDMKAECRELEKVIFEDAPIPFHFDLLVTSRPYKITTCRIPHEILKVCGFDKFHRRAFVEKWFGEVGKEIADKLKDLIDNGISLKKLGRIPLLLNLICRIYEDGYRRADLIASGITITEVFERLFELMIRRTDQSAIDVTNWKEAPAIQALGQVSLDNIMSTEKDYQVNFTRQQIESALEFLQEDSHQGPITDLLCKLGVIQSDGVDEDTFSFLHRTMMEFCAAVRAIQILKKNPLSKEMSKAEAEASHPTFEQLINLYNPWQIVQVNEFISDLVLISQDKSLQLSAAKLISLIDPRVQGVIELRQSFSLTVPLDVPWSMIKLLTETTIFIFQATFEYLSAKMTDQYRSVLNNLPGSEVKVVGKHSVLHHIKSESSANGKGVNLLVCRDQQIPMRVGYEIPTDSVIDYCVTTSYGQCFKEFLYFWKSFPIGHLHIDFGHKDPVTTEEEGESDDSCSSSEEEIEQFDEDSRAVHQLENPVAAPSSAPLPDPTQETPRPTAQTGSRLSIAIASKFADSIDLRETIKDLQSTALNQVKHLALYGQQHQVTNLATAMGLLNPRSITLSALQLTAEEWAKLIECMVKDKVSSVALHKCNIPLNALQQIASNAQHLATFCLSNISALRETKSQQWDNLQTFLDSWHQSMPNNISALRETKSQLWDNLQTFLDSWHLSMPKNLAEEKRTNLILCNHTLSGVQVLQTDQFIQAQQLGSTCVSMFNNDWLPKDKQPITAIPGATPRATPSIGILTTGGYGAGRSIQIYSLVTNTSRMLSTAMREERRGHVSGVLRDGRVMLAGGVNSDGYALSSTELIDPVTRQPTPGPPMNTARRDASSAVLNGDFYVGGGTDEKGNLLSSCERFRDGEWTKVSDMYVARWGYAMVAVNKYIYAIGGRGKNRDLLDSVERYCPETDNWQIVTHSNYKRWDLAAAECNGCIYVFGGLAGNYESLRICERYSPIANRWQRMADMNLPRSDLCLVSVGGKLYAVGGGGGQKSVECYDVGKDKWEMVGKLRVGKWGHSAVVVPYS